MNRELHLIGYAYGGAGADPHTSEGALVMHDSRYLAKSNIQYVWDAMISLGAQTEAIQDSVKEINTELASVVANMVKQKKFFTVIGGDHTSAIGTWSGAYQACHTEGNIGLIWVDAHMDSHTPETSLSGRIHGMPLAVLLGAGYDNLVGLYQKTAKFKPENVCLIGVRSFESGEAEFLAKHNVRIFYMDEVIRRGFKTVMREAIVIVSENTIGFGISLDLDGIDPKDAPAVAVPEADGISITDLLSGLSLASNHKKLIGTEIVEFDPVRDIDHKTEKVIVSILDVFSRYQT